MHEIICHDRIRDILENELSEVRDNLQVISAYCKISALSYVDSKLASAPITKRLMVRFRLDDILSRATDLKIYEYCKKKNWDLYIQLDPHAKTFVFDHKRCIVGSANLTSKGIGLVEDSNLEMAVLADVAATEMSKINFLFDKSTLMTDNLYELMKNQVENTVPNHSSVKEWNDNILRLVKDDIAVLFTQDFPKSESPFSLSMDDFSMLGISEENNDINSIREAFKSSRGFRWLIAILKESENKQMYFGEITATLHDALINDPRPYRKEVKYLLSNLLEWISELQIESINIERPNYSQLISLS